MRFQPHHLGSQKIALETQDVVHLGPAPAVDRLVVVADAAQVLPTLRQQPQPEVLRDVGVLVLVDQDVFEPIMEIGQHVRMLGEDGQVVQQEVAEVAGVQHPQPVLVERVELAAAVVGEGRALGRRQLGRNPAAVLPVVDQAGEVARGPALAVDVLGFQQLISRSWSSTSMMV